MSESVIIQSKAKINLFLHILGKNANNYHNLESIFYFPEIGDKLEVEKSDRFQLICKGAFAKQLPLKHNENIIFKSLELLKKLYPDQITNLSITLTKNLPIASGIGGGSGNAATILNVANSIFNLGLSTQKLCEIGLQIGADVPSCIYSKPLFVTGIGENLKELPNFPSLNILIVNPLKPVSTKKIFEMGFKNYSKPIDVNFNDFTNFSKLIAFLQNTKNDMQQIAISLCPEIEDILQFLSKQKGVLLARMSGSGASCFAIFETQENLTFAKKIFQKKHPNYWAISTSQPPQFQHKH